MKKIAVVLFNLGGPADLKSVRPFLFNLFKDRAIVNLPAFIRYPLAALIAFRRAKTTKKIYELIEGKSPLLQITNAQGEALEKELSYDSNQYKVFTCMRYWHPMSKRVVSKIKEYQPNEIILLPLYPQFSTTTTASSFKDFGNEIIKQRIKAKLKYICCYPNNEQFIFAHSKLIIHAIKKTEAKGFKNFRLLFSAHGIPQNIVDDGDPYVFQIQTSTKAIIKELEKNLKLKKGNKLDHKICYQSKVGPTQWTSPSLDLEIKRAAIEKKAIIVIPISFVSDHCETLVELDMKYKQIAENKGVPFYLRVPALNQDGYFIKSLAEICQNTAKSNVICKSAGQKNKVCPAKFQKCLG